MQGCPLDACILSFWGMPCLAIGKLPCTSSGEIYTTAAKLGIQVTSAPATILCDNKREEQQLKQRAPLSCTVLFPTQDHVAVLQNVLI